MTEVSAAAREAFIARFGGVYEHSPWVAARALERGGIGPAAAGRALTPAFRAIVEEASREEKLALLRAHPDLAGRIGIASLSAASKSEQEGAGLAHCTPAEATEFYRLNDAYRARFGFPFIIAVRGLGRARILDAFRARLGNAPEAEFATALEEVHKIARLRLEDLCR